MKRFAVMLMGLAVASVPLPAVGDGATGLEATVTPFTDARVSNMTGPTFDAAGRPLGQAQWRVIDGTGNCCENYIAVSKTGRLFDFGGSFPRISDDQGLNWSQVNPAVPLTLGGEGAVSQAPGGDIVGMVWEPYSGDRVITFKYESATGDWLHSELLLHTPFFDRPWLSVIPGPFTVGGQSIPYISVLASNVLREVYYYSVDGLNYVLPTTRLADQFGAPRVQPLDLTKDPETDWLQSITEFGVAPLPGGGALAGHDQIVTAQSGDLLWMDPPDFMWHPLDLPGELPVGRVIADSAGRLHHVSTSPASGSFTYRMSRDGGRSWTAAPVTLPAGFGVEDWDFRTNSNLDIAVVGLHVEQGNIVDKDLVYEFDLSTEKAVLRRFFQVGLGDQASEGGITNDIRFDFSTIGIFPDGQIVTTFLDSKHLFPALAVLISAPVPAGAPGPSPAPTITSRPDPPPSPAPAPSSSPTTEPGSEEDTAAPLISGVTDAPDPFSPNGDRKKERVTITFNVNEEAAVSVVVRRKGRLVRKLLPKAERGAGSWSEVWNGRSDAGRRLGRGRYTYVIKTTDAAGNTSRATGAVTLNR